MTLPVDRTTANTAAEHVADHNTLHEFYNDAGGGEGSFVETSPDVWAFVPDDGSVAIVGLGAADDGSVGIQGAAEASVLATATEGVASLKSTGPDGEVQVSGTYGQISFTNSVQLYSTGNASAINIVASGTDSNVNISGSGLSYFSGAGGDAMLELDTAGATLTATNDIALTSENVSVTTTGWTSIDATGDLDLSSTDTISIQVGAASGNVFVKATGAGGQVQVNGSAYLALQSPNGDIGFTDSVGTITLAEIRAGLPVVANRQTASYGLVLADAGKVVEMNVASGNNLTGPLNSTQAFPVGTCIELFQYGAGQTTVVATGGVTIRSSGGKLKLTGQYSAGSLRKIATDEWCLVGDIAT